jgi:hypothetical protein
MTKQIIPGDQWKHFFSGLNREYAQKMVTLEMVPEIEGPQLVAFDEPFGGISTDEHADHTTITIRLGDASDLTLETPLRVSSEPFAGGGGQVVEIEVAGTPLTRLYLSHSTKQSTGRGEIYGGGAGHMREADRAPADPPRDYIDQSTRAAGIIGEANTGGGYGPPTDRQPAATARSQDQGPASVQSNAMDDEQIAGVRLGIGLGGIREIGGGGLGDRDLSGRVKNEWTDLEEIFDIDDTAAGPDGAGSISAQRNSDADIVDLGSSAGVIDSTRDPIGGTGDEDNSMDESPNMVEGEVGAQAERDLTKLLGRHTGRRDADDARLQQRLTELIEEQDDEAD